MGARHTTNRSRQAVVISVLAVVAVAIVGLLAAQRLHQTQHADPPPPSSSSATASTPVAVSTPHTTHPAPPPRKPTVAPRARVDAAVAKLAAELPAGGVSVAALNTRTGARYSYGATGGMRLGSVYKLLVLETLLLQHQDSGTQLSDYELSQATPMIANSDNKAAYQLFLDIGGNQGMAAGAARLGMAHTMPGVSDPTLTTSSAPDGVALVRNLVTNGPLDQYSRSVALGLLHQVESDQRWGVGAAADPGSSFVNKNGWLSVDNTNTAAENDNGLWLVTSVGIVTVHAQQVLMAVFTQHADSYEDGVDLCNALAKAITPAVVAR